MANCPRLIFLVLVLAFALLAGRASHLSAPLVPDTAHAAQEAGETEAVALTQVIDDDDDHHHMWGDWDGWGWWLFMPMMVVFWIGVIALVVWLVRQASGNAGDRGETAIEIARQRYARGEISREEFEQIRRDLGG